VLDLAPGDQILHRAGAGVYLGRPIAGDQHRRWFGQPPFLGTGVIGGMIMATALAIILVSLFFRPVTRSVERKSKAGVAPSTAGEPK